MKTKALCIVWLLPFCLLAQTRIDKTFPIQSAKKLNLDFDYPEIVRVSTWDRQEVAIKGTVSINRGENDEAFELKNSVEDNILHIESSIKDKDRLPKRLLIKRGTEEYYFKTDNYHDPEVRKFLDEKGGDYRYMNNGVIIEVELEVFIPKGMETSVLSKYGIVEIVNCDAPITVDARYGGVDVTIPAKGLTELTARTKFGEIYTNLSQKPVASDYAEDHNHWTSVTYNLGSGSKVFVESKYGKVYLRKEL